MTAKKASRTQMFGALVSSLAEDNSSDGNVPGKGSSAAARPDRVGSGVVAATKESVIAELREERDKLRAQLADQSTNGFEELDPTLIDPSPFPDRLADDASEAAIEALRLSIAERGQEIPILVRPHPDEEGRYQIAYGHRRLKAVSGLPGLKIRAIVRALSDAELVQAQGVENSARQDLSFIERVLFAAHVRALSPDPREEVSRVKLALSITDAEASYLKRVHSLVPDDLIRAIGPAPRIGRPRWMKLAELLEQETLMALARERIDTASFKAEGLSDDRFQHLLDSLLDAVKAPRKEAPAPIEIMIGGTRLGHCKHGSRKSELTLLDPDFARHLEEKLPDLYKDYKSN